MITDKLRARCGPFVIDFGSRELRRGNERVPLDQKPFDLLEYFVENRNKLLSYNEIRGSVWGADHISSLPKTVCEVRRALGEFADWIENYRHRGYIFRGPIEWIDADQPTVLEQIKQIAAEPSIENLLLLQQTKIAIEEARDEMINNLPESERADFLYDVVKRADNELSGPDQVRWFDTLEFQWVPLQETLDYLSKRDPAREIEMAIILGRFFNIRGLWTEGQGILKDALTRHPEDSNLRAQALAWRGYLNYRLDNEDLAKELLEESRLISLAGSDQRNLAFTLSCLAFVTEACGRYGEAKTLAQDALMLAQRLNDPWAQWFAYRGLGWVAQAEGKYTQAKDLHQKSYAKAKQLGDVAGMAVALNSFGVAEIGLHEYNEAQRTHQKSLQYVKATGFQNGIARAYCSLGMIDHRRGNHLQAEGYFRKSLGLFHKIGNKIMVAVALENTARMVHHTGQPEDAARIYGAATGIREGIRVFMSPSDQSEHGELISSLQTQFQAQYQEGKQWNEADAVRKLG